jgi:hypothetical protein
MLQEGPEVGVKLERSAPHLGLEEPDDLLDLARQLAEDGNDWLARNYINLPEAQERLDVDPCEIGAVAGIGDGECCLTAVWVPDDAGYAEVANVACSGAWRLYLDVHALGDNSDWCHKLMLINSS